MIFVLSFKLLEEADLDESGFLSYAEFENVIARSPEFMKWVERTDQPIQATQCSMIFASLGSNSSDIGVRI